MKTVFDIGMWDGTDSAYYLELGYRVIAVEPNPVMVELARQRFAAAVGSGQLVIESVAVALERGTATLTLNDDNSGASSLLDERTPATSTAGRLTVPTVRLADLLEAHGVPHYMKVDIEGADRYCVLALTRDQAPPYVSFEMGEDADELIMHLNAIGYDRFKIIHQTSFRELANVECLYDRVARRTMRLLGYADPQLVRRGRRFFWSGHCSGPVPEVSDGRWAHLDAVLNRWRSERQQRRGGGVWYDLHAGLGQAAR